MADALPVAIADDLASMLAEKLPVAIDGFGSFELREYTSFGGTQTIAPKTLPFLVAAPALGEMMENAERAPPSFRCPPLTARTARRIGVPEPSVEHALERWLSTVVERLRASRFVEPLGSLGMLRVREKRSKTATRTVLGFVASTTLRARVNGLPAPARFGSPRLDELLAAYPPSGFRDRESLETALLRLHQKRRNGVDVPAIERTIGQPLPPLLSVLLGFKAPPVASTVLTTTAAYVRALREHRDLMKEWGRAPGVPFAVEANGDSWCFCDHAGAGDDSWVFLAGPDASSIHSHDLRFGEWLAASLLLAELSREAKGAVLAEAELMKVLAYLRRVAPTAETLLVDLPF